MNLVFCQDQQNSIKDNSSTKSDTVLDNLKIQLMSDNDILLFTDFDYLTPLLYVNKGEFLRI